MSDRNDPSQFRFTAGPADGTAALPSTAMTMDQIQTAPSGDYADAVELTSHPDHAEAHGGRPDLIHEHPGRFYTQAPGKTRDIGKPRQVSPYGGTVVAGGGLIAGWNFHETTGVTDAVVRLRDGNDAGAPVLAFLPLVAGESTRDWFLPGAIKFINGLYVEVASGSIEALIYTVETEHRGQ